MVYSTLKRKKPLNRMSLKKIIELNSQVELRVNLCRKAGGTPFIKTSLRHLNNGQEIELQTVICTNGYCQECGEFTKLLDCHENNPRSLGGKVTAENSRYLCRSCHRKKKGSPMWGI